MFNIMSVVQTLLLYGCDGKIDLCVVKYEFNEISPVGCEILSFANMVSCDAVQILLYNYGSLCDSKNLYFSCIGTWNQWNMNQLFLGVLCKTYGTIQLSRALIYISALNIVPRIYRQCKYSFTMLFNNNYYGYIYIICQFIVIRVLFKLYPHYSHKISITYEQHNQKWNLNDSGLLIIRCLKVFMIYCHVDNIR